MLLYVFQPSKVAPVAAVESMGAWEYVVDSCGVGVDCWILMDGLKSYAPVINELGTSLTEIAESANVR